MPWSLLLLAALAGNPPGANAKAQQLTRRCMAEYEAGNFDAALADATAAYAVEPVPGLLYDLAQIHRALHHWEEAATAYRSYLRKLPSAANRARVEGFIVEMDQRRAEQLSNEQVPSRVLTQAVVETLAAEPAPEPAAAETPPQVPQRLAVLDVQPYGGVGAGFARSVTAVVVQELRKRLGTGLVVGADEIRAVVGVEHQKALLACAQGACLAQLGGALSVEQFALGSLSLLGKTYVLDLRLLDSHSARVLAQGSARFSSDEGVPEAVAKAVGEMLAPSAGVRP